jgi:hypothetical protein
VNQSYLIQRLQKPFASERMELQNLFSFGGGLVNGGLSKEAMVLLSTIFRFDYMGSAEFEFGALPKTLSKIYESRQDYTGFNTKVKWKYKDWSCKKPVHVTGEQTIYVICHKDWQEEVKSRIKLYAMDRYHETKEMILLNSNLWIANSKDKTPDTVGWLELDNGYFFFIDEEMFGKTCALFGIVKSEKE